MYKTRENAFRHARGLGPAPRSEMASVRAQNAKIAASLHKLERLAHAAVATANLEARRLAPLAPLNIMPIMVRKNPKSPTKKPRMSKKVYDSLMRVLKNTQRAFLGEYPETRVHKMSARYSASKKASVGRSTVRTANARKAAATLRALSKGLH